MSAKPKGADKRPRVSRHTTMRIPPELMQWLGEQADRERRSKTFLVIQAIEEFRDRIRRRTARQAVPEVFQ
jgi:predicted transcriptional regulator